MTARSADTEQVDRRSDWLTGRHCGSLWLEHLPEMETIDWIGASNGMDVVHNGDDRGLTETPHTLFVLPVV